MADAWRWDEPTPAEAAARDAAGVDDPRVHAEAPEYGEASPQAEASAYAEAPEYPESSWYPETAAAGTMGEASVDGESLLPSGFAEWFVVAQTAIPALLFLPGSQALRLPIRVGAYGAAIAGLCLWWFRGRPKGVAHPAEGWLWLAALWLGIMIAHPFTSSLSGGVAQAVLYIAVFSGLFWAPPLVAHPRGLVRILAILLVCNGLNATVGVLQVYDPDRFMPRELSFAFSGNRDALAAATYVGANGRAVVRPPGLFDTPGAVCGPGTVAALLGLIFALQPLAWWKRAASLGMSVAGLAAIYLSHVRANFVITVGMMAAYAVLLVAQRQPRRAVTFGALCGAVLITAFLGSSLLGGEAIADRFSTLLDDDPRALYYNSRGRQLSVGFTEFASQYPLGAGLARWGLMNSYFGDPANLDSTPPWAEVQPTAWIFDGGLVLVCLYVGALGAVLFYHWRLVRELPDPRDQRWAAAVVAVNVGTIALIFSFVPFTTQVGLQFWFLEGALHGAMRHRPDGDA